MTAAWSRSWNPTSSGSRASRRVPVGVGCPVPARAIQFSIPNPSPNPHSAEPQSRNNATGVKSRMKYLMTSRRRQDRASRRGKVTAVLSSDNELRSEP